jgi:hypothetical protein
MPQIFKWKKVVVKIILTFSHHAPPLSFPQVMENQVCWGVFNTILRQSQLKKSKIVYRRVF